MPLDPRNPQDLARAEEVAARLREQWRNDPNVVQIAPGLKIAGGRVQPDELILAFFVRRKLSPDEVIQSGLQPVPPEVEGIPTDVEPINARPLASPLPKRRERKDPLLGGLALGNGNIQWNFGTLGAIIFDNATGVAKALTNEHVLVYTNEGRAGDPVIQPAPPRLQDFIDLDFVPKCCPIGPIFFIQTGGPVSAFLAWAAVVAGVVALSDVRDPTKRGQTATFPAPGERTLREQVEVALEYPDFPIPGSPYKVDVNWNYTRVTTGASYTHSVTETNANPHVLSLQRIVTDRATYHSGETVQLLATLGIQQHKPCDAFYVIAYLVPGAVGQQHRSHMVVLHSASDVATVSGQSDFPDLSAQQQPAPEVCDDFADLQPGINLPTVFTHGSLTYRNHNVFIPMRTVDRLPAGSPNGISELSFSERGISIRLPFPVASVTAYVAQFTNQPVELRAFDGASTLLGSVTAPNVQKTEHRLEISAPGIVLLNLTGGGNEGMLVRLCYNQGRMGGRQCFYTGRVALDPLDPLGPWRIYLFAQTINDVAEGTDPEVAAPTIGGLPVTRNFEHLGEGSVPPYGQGCIFQPFVDGDFEVVP